MRLPAGLISALQWLTVLPLPARNTVAAEGTFVLGVAAWFPWVGLLIGGLACGAAWLSGVAWGETVRAVVLVLMVAALSGGLHLDGLSDTFDALLSWRPREQKLAIMRDSRIGAMGALAMIAVLALKFAWVSAAREEWWRAALVATVLGRWAMVHAAFFFPAARESGMGQQFRAQLRASDVRMAWVASALLVLLISLAGEPNVLVALARAGLALTVVGVTVHALAARWTRALGGLTGDTYGALCEIAEAAALAAMSAWR